MSSVNIGRESPSGTTSRRRHPHRTRGRTRTSVGNGAGIVVDTDTRHWAFPADKWVENIQGYVEFRDEYHRAHGFRCNLPCGAYFVRRDQSSLLSYTHDGDMFSIDPIHAPGERDKDAWAAFLRAFNEWAHARGGIPLLNQSPFVTREHVTAAYGDRWTQLCDWQRSVDPDKRMVNEFFAALM